MGILSTNSEHYEIPRVRDVCDARRMIINIYYSHPLFLGRSCPKNHIFHVHAVYLWVKNQPIVGTLEDTLGHCCELLVSLCFAPKSLSGSIQRYHVVKCVKPEFTSVKIVDETNNTMVSIYVDR